MDSHTEDPLVNATVQLEKFPGRGSWTFARIPEIRQEMKNHLSWKKVRGYIEDFEIIKSYLKPIGKGQLFLPVKAEIRKKIKNRQVIGSNWFFIQLFKPPRLQSKIF